MFIISGPAGSGKGTVVKALMKKHPELVLSVSATTRQPRPGEEHGREYFFLSMDEFKRRIKDGDFLEYDEHFGNFYGTPIAPVKKLLNEGKTVILIIEVEGGENVKKVFPDAVKIFIIPPSLEELERRLRGRGTDSNDAIEARLQIAKTELTRAFEYDYIIENDILENAVNDVLSVIRAEQLKIDIMQNKLREVNYNA